VEKVRLNASAKINLYLRVLGRRPDGYHDIESLLTRISLADTVSIETRSSGIEVKCPDHPGLDGPANLAYQAAKRYLAANPHGTGPWAGVSIRIQKEIPVAAGLGGGSTDAATVLEGLQRLSTHPLKKDKLLQIAAGLGADVPFFLNRGPCIARGVGHDLEPVADLPEFWLLLACSPKGLATRKVYENLNYPLTSTRGGARNINSVRSAGMEGIVSWLHNDLQAVSERLYPAIRSVRMGLLRAGAEGALMSGSGPSVFGLFRSRRRALDGLGRIASEGNWKYLVVQGETTKTSATQ